jgi:hypothetical protein
MPDQPYAAPPDDGGDQGSFTRPQESLAQPNAAAPEDRESAGTLWAGRQQRASEAGGGNSMLLMIRVLMLLAVAALLAGYCGTR